MSGEHGSVVGRVRRCDVVDALRVADKLVETEEPREKELEILRSLVPSEKSNVAELIPSTADLE